MIAKEDLTFDLHVVILIFYFIHSLGIMRTFMIVYEIDMVL